MANVVEEEEFVVLSKVRAGHKREFQFALKSQNEIAGLLSRTRVRKVPVTKLNDFPAANKIMKISAGRMRKKMSPPKGMESEDEPESDVVDVMSDDECNRHHIVESQRRENVKVNGSEDESDHVVDDERSSVLKKFPTKLKELLETGLLEGLSVKYIRGCKKFPSGTGLAGIVRGCGILCFCDDCQGIQVVTPNQFELHAGSANKRPPDYIFLENGKSLRDIMTACKNANPKYLEVTILNAISSSTEKKLAFCVECKEPISDAGIGRTALLCSSCSESEASCATPIQGIDTYERYGQPVSQISSSRASKTSSQSDKNQGKITLKDLRLHRLVFQGDNLPEGTELGYYVHGKKLLSGYKLNSGIFCYCCNEEVSPSQFEAHAGFPSRRKPYLNIYTSNGVSLHELSLTLSRTSQFSTDENDDLCSVCHGTGDLLCCDGCPRSFHLECISLPRVPQNKWYCKCCEDMFQKEKFAERNPNAIAAGRVPGVDPIEQITNRCIRIVKTINIQDSGGCTLCRVQDFCKSGFGPRTVIICDQCEKEYHVGCMRKHKMQDLKELPVGDWFCCSDCERINSFLKNLIEGGEQKLPDHLNDVVKKKVIEKDSSVSDLEVTWRVLNGGKLSLDEMRPFLSKAVSVFHEQFDPILYGELKQDLIPHMVYGRNLKGKEFGGMFCAVITVNSIIVSSAVFRVFGKEVVEVPLVATSKDCVGRGYFQCLYSCMERLFEDLGVKNILLPSAEETRSLWMTKFGFSEMPQEELDDLRKRYALMIFDGTSMLHKMVPRSET
ncbi:hypothetical protein SOVF_014680 [Spinacia oleracea]|uniref:PHD-type domain-containing protein n=1 Tax=Spinacia oleracea TaxID=3562 RepID=A0A9R0I6Y2_SPIOL|nr:uncharacterized protein LOC110783728 [Spinacia oleracea]KNA24549.1 hypothetical protein SOVF_014680 [Spinacia oleracea]